MSRNESDREDLLAEATALVRRVELQVDGELEPVVAGVRDNGRLSIYFGGEPVYHFDETGRLRRAFADGCLYRTQETTLSRMNRERTESSTLLLRHDLNETELAQFLAEMRDRLSQLMSALQNDHTKLLRSVPTNDDFRPELENLIQQILHSDSPLAPTIPGKR